jgi:TonB family protein
MFESFVALSQSRMVLRRNEASGPCAGVAGPFLFLVILTSILTGCTSNPPTYSIGGSEFLTFEQAAAALMEESAPGEGALGLDQPTRLIHAVPFPYPSEARRAGIEGRVIVEVEVDERGNVARTAVIGESHKLLADAAVHAVSQWKFRPHTYRGTPVKARLRYPVTFKLNPPDDPAPTPVTPAAP